jgi:hypothetical protein
MRFLSSKVLQVTIKEIVACHFQGFSISNQILSRYTQILNEANRLLKPIAVVKFLPFLVIQGLIAQIKEVLPATWEILVPFQSTTAGAYVVFCTIGPYLEEEVRKSNDKGEIARAFIIDIIGSVAVVKYSKYINLLISKEVAARGWESGGPIMPGTRGIDLELQRILFDIVDAKQIGIRLTKQNVLVPLKSMSMIIGVGPKVKIGLAEHDCKICPEMNKCYLKEIWRITEQSNEENGS